MDGITPQPESTTEPTSVDDPTLHPHDAIHPTATAMAPAIPAAASPSSTPDGLCQRQHIPIAQLSPSLSAGADATGASDAAPATSEENNPSDGVVIKAVVTLIWPYSASSKTLAMLFAEPDFRLRRSRGQVRVRFTGPCAAVVADAHLGSGDEVTLGMRGVEWISMGDSKDATGTPGRGIEWELSFKNKIWMEVLRQGSSTVIDFEAQPTTPINQSEEPPTAIATVLDVAPPNPQPTTANKSGVLDESEWSSPAFIKRARTSYGSLFEDGYDVFADSHRNHGKARKRARLSRLSSTWRYSSRSPSPEDQSDVEARNESPIPAMKIGRETHPSLETTQEDTTVPEITTTEVTTDGPDSGPTQTSAKALGSGSSNQLSQRNSPSHNPQIGLIASSDSSPYAVVVDRSPTSEPERPTSPRIAPVASELLPSISPFPQSTPNPLQPVFAHPAESQDWTMAADQSAGPPAPGQLFAIEASISQQEASSLSHGFLPFSAAMVDTGLAHIPAGIGARDHYEHWQTSAAVYDSFGASLAPDDPGAVLATMPVYPEVPEMTGRNSPPYFGGHPLSSVGPTHSLHPSGVPEGTSNDVMSMEPQGSQVRESSESESEDESEQSEEVEVIPAQQTAPAKLSMFDARSEAAAEAEVDEGEEEDNEDDEEFSEGASGSMRWANNAIGAANSDEFYEEEEDEELDEEHFDEENEYYESDVDDEPAAKPQTGSKPSEPIIIDLLSSDDEEELIEEVGSVDESKSGVTSAVPQIDGAAENDAYQHDVSMADDDVDAALEESGASKEETYTEEEAAARKLNILHEVDSAEQEDKAAAAVVRHRMESLNDVQNSHGDAEQMSSEARDEEGTKEGVPPGVADYDDDTLDVEQIKQPVFTDMDTGGNADTNHSDSNDQQSGNMTTIDEEYTDGTIVLVNEPDFLSDAVSGEDLSGDSGTTVDPITSIQSHEEETATSVIDQDIHQREDENTNEGRLPHQEDAAAALQSSPAASQTDHGLTSEPADIPSSTAAHIAGPAGDKNSEAFPQEFNLQLPTPAATQVYSSQPAVASTYNHLRTDLASSQPTTSADDRQQDVPSTPDVQPARATRSSTRSAAKSTNAQQQSPEPNTAISPSLRIKTRQQPPHRRTRSISAVIEEEQAREVDASAQLAMASPPPQNISEVSPVIAEDSIRLRLTRSFRTNLADFTPLKQLRQHLDAKLDVLGMVTGTPSEPQRSKGGPRHFQLSFNITDASIGPNAVANITIFRPHVEALPQVEEGDGVLLRNFTVQSIKNRGFGLRSTLDTSSWAVFKADGDVDVRGPPVELGDGEKSYIVLLRSWYRELDATALAKLERANAQRNPAKGANTRGRSSGKC